MVLVEPLGEGLVEPYGHMALKNESKTTGDQKWAETGGMISIVGLLY